MADFPILVDAGALSVTGSAPVVAVDNVYSFTSGSIATVAMTGAGAWISGNAYSVDLEYLYYYNSISYIDVAISAGAGVVLSVDIEINDVSVFGEVVTPEPLPEFNVVASLATGQTAEIEASIQDVQCVSTIISGNICDVAALLPEFSLHAYDGNALQAQLEPIVCEAILLPGVVASLTVDTAGISVVGSLLSEGVLSGNLEIPDISLLCDMYSGNVSSISIYAPELTTISTFLSGVVGTSSSQVPAITLSAELYSDITMDGELSLFVLILDAIGVTDSGSIVYSATPARVMNVSNKAITEYTNYRFNSFTSVGSMHFGASETGIYLLSGDNDAGANINSRVVLGVTDFGSSFYKRVEYAYIAYSTDGNMRLKITTDSNDMFEYFMAPTGKTRHHSARVSLARGARTRYIQPELLNDSGADFTISKIELVGAISNKRM